MATTSKILFLFFYSAAFGWNSAAKTIMPLIAKDTTIANERNNTLFVYGKYSLVPH